MPHRKNKRRVRIGERLLSERTRTRLLGGADWPFLDPPGRPGEPLSDDDLRTAWLTLRDDLMGEFIGANPGQRPWAFWAFDSREGRRLVRDPKWVSFDGDKKIEGQGIPPEDRGLPLSFGMSTSAVVTDEDYESERQYLQRNDLLSRAETAALARATEV